MVPKKKPKIDYIDTDVAYLVGMITARGTFHQEQDVRRLIIQFPYRHDAMTPLPNSQLNTLDRETALRLSLDSIRSRVNELLEVNLRVNRREHEVSLSAVFSKETMGWRNLRLITGGKSNYLGFEVPEVIFDSEFNIQKEFLRGFVDTSCDPSYSDRDQGERQRIVIQVQYGNWLLPIQLCRLLQENLDIPVSHILWGHPNIRSPGGGSSWAKETRIRVIAEAFEPIGFNFEYKQRMLEEMVLFNRENGYPEPKRCNPKIKKLRKGQRKQHHQDEDSDKLPEFLRSRHFNSYYKLCCAVGCKQGRKGAQREFFDLGEES